MIDLRLLFSSVYNSTKTMNLNSSFKDWSQDIIHRNLRVKKNTALQRNMTVKH